MKKSLVWVGVGVRVGVDFSKPESESLKSGRLRRPGHSASQWSVVGSYHLSVVCYKSTAPLSGLL